MNAHTRRVELASTDGALAVVSVFSLDHPDPLASIEFSRHLQSQRQAMSRDDLVVVRDAINAVLVESEDAARDGAR